MRLVVIGLSLSSSWGNGHATTFRALLRAFAARGHTVTFLERDVPWYASNRDLPDPDFCRLELYRDIGTLFHSHERLVREADAVVLGSFVPDGIAVGRWVQATVRGVKAFYDIDTPVTLARLAAGACDYLDEALVPGFDLYLSFTGGPTLRRLERAFGARSAHALFCSVDPSFYRPLPVGERWTLGYLGTYSDDRQPKVERLLLGPARRLEAEPFVVAGPQYPDEVAWPANVERIDHLPPAEHPGFYAAQRFTLNVTRADMVEAGFAPSVRLFEAAACGTPIVSDRWPGLDELFEPGSEILIADTTEDVLEQIAGTDAARRRRIASAARRRVLSAHSADVRARELETLLADAASRARGAGTAVQMEIFA